ncbi:MAG: hypothetical protein WB502_09935 [Thermoactinomyces sp.]
MDIAGPIGSLSLLILYLSGWFQNWGEDFGTSRSNLIFVLLTMSVLSWCRPWEMNEHFFVHPGWIGFLLVFFSLGYNFSVDSRLKLLCSSLCTGTFFLFLHELMNINADWANKSFQFVLVCGVVLFSCLVSVRLCERIWYTGMCLMILHALILYFYREVLNPRILGAEAFMGTLWLSLIGILLITDLENAIRFRGIKKRQPHCP